VQVYIRSDKGENEEEAGEMKSKKIFNRKKIVKLFAIIALGVLFISLLPILKVSFYDRATGDDYANGAVARQTLLQTHSFFYMIVAVCRQVRKLWTDYQGTWFSVFLFALQPEVFSFKAYWIVAWIALTLLISSISIFLYTIFVYLMGWQRDSYLIVDSVVLIMIIQFVYSPRAELFWYNGMIHYTVAFSLAIFSMNCMVKFIQTNRSRYIVEMAVMMTMLGGMSYLSAFMAPLFMFLVWILSYRRRKYVWKMWIPLALECIGLVISAAAPGNANRGGSGYSVSFDRVVISIGKAILQGTAAIPVYFKGQKPIIFLLMVIIFYLFIWDAVNRAEYRDSNFQDHG
jgi:hypothetical protein